MSLFIMCHFFVKAFLFFELVKGTSFYILFSFQISALRLFMAVCGLKVGKIKLFWKHWAKSDHKDLTRSHSENTGKDVSSKELQKEHRGDGFILKV